MFENLISLISKEKQKQIDRFRIDVDKKLSLYSEILIRMIICETLSIGNDQIVFGKNAYGKPHLIGYPDFYFNLSHTNSAIIVAVSDKPIGVDIEKIRYVDLKIAERFFTKNEVACIIESESDIHRRFFKIWTQKEAYIKYIGKGLHMPLNSFDVRSNNISLHIKTDEKDGYVFSVCSGYKNPKYDMIGLSESNIENMML